MSLRNAGNATPEAIQKLAETNLELASENRRLREALEFYADPFRIMDFIDGTYTIRDEWYGKARAALLERKK